MGTLADMRGALALLTVVPAPDSAAAPTPRVAAWFPWTGLVPGAAAFALVAAADAASAAWGDGQFTHRASLLLAVLISAVWAGITRMLHWDGLADVADAWWGGSALARRLEIMSDSHVGAFGATAVAFASLAQIAALALLLGDGSVAAILLAAPVFGRGAAMFGAWLGTPARPGGLGALVVGRPSGAGMVVGAAGLALASVPMLVAIGSAGAVLGGIGFVLAAVVPHVLSRRFGGVTGDVLGASVLIAEISFLVAAAFRVAW